jgi:ribosome biogenesis protein BRX1
MHLQNLHTMEELHFTGNCLKGSRPVLSFDATFETEPHLRVIKELLTHTFGVPKGARKSKPFVDHIMGFTVADGRIWIRCYQINEEEPGKPKVGVDGMVNSEGVGETSAGAAEGAVVKKSKNTDSRETNISLVEIGPRFVLTPIVIQESSFGGPIIYENKEFVSPNQVRSDIRQKKASRYGRRADETGERTAKRSELGLKSNGKRRPRDAMDNREVFA